MKSAIVAVMLCLFATCAQAEVLTGGDLEKACRTPGTRSICDAYIAGVSDGAAATADHHVGTLHQRPVACPPFGVNNEQIEAVAKKFLSDHPEKLHLQASVLVIGSLLTAFPCCTK
jgi:hypothetical protein